MQTSILITILLSFSLGAVLANPILPDSSPLEKRFVCNANNCLRQLQHASASASPFCSSYLSPIIPVTVTSTATATVTTTPSVKPPSTAAAPSTTTTSTPSPTTTSTTTTPAPVQTLTSSPTFVTSCTGAATALSSGCSCLLSAALPTTTVTTTTTTTLSHCGAQNAYGIGNVGGYYFGTHSPDDFTNMGYDSRYHGDCCGRCYTTPNCYTFQEEEVDTPDGEVLVCYLYELKNGTVDASDYQCPYGLVRITPTGQEDGITGQGPCGVYSVLT